MSRAIGKARMNTTPLLSSRNSSSNSRFTKSRRRQIIAQNFVVLWLDPNIRESNEDFQNSIAQVHTTVNALETFTDANECAMFLTQIEDQKILLIVSSSVGESFVPLIHENPHLDSIYLFCPNEETSIQWTQNWYKIRGVFSEIKPICHSLKQDIKRCEHNLEPMSIVPLTNSYKEKLDKIDESFMYTQILKEVLLNMDYDESALQELIEFCCDLYKDNVNELNIIKEFETDYDRHSPIWWYTRECFTYRMLNRALRTQDLDTVIKMGFFMRDVHRQIQELHSKFINKKSFTVYRGQGILRNDFEKLQNSQNGLLSFNNFLSTSLDELTSLTFARNARDQFGMIGIHFRMKIDPKNTTTPFAPVGDVGFYRDSEKEILFSMHTIFRISEVKNIGDQLWQVELEMTADDDQQLQVLIAHIRFDIRGSTERHRLGNLMIHLGQFDNAEKFYQKLLDSTSQYDQTEIAHLSNQLAYIMEQKGDYERACCFYQRTLEIEEKFFPSTHPRLADIYHNIGIVNEKMKDYKSALYFFQRAVDIGQYNNFPEDDARFQFWKDNIDYIQKRM